MRESSGPDPPPWEGVRALDCVVDALSQNERIRFWRAFAVCPSRCPCRFRAPGKAMTVVIPAWIAASTFSFHSPTFSLSRPSRSEGNQSAHRDFRRSVRISCGSVLRVQSDVSRPGNIATLYSQRPLQLGPPLGMAPAGTHEHGRPGTSANSAGSDAENSAARRRWKTSVSAACALFPSHGLAPTGPLGISLPRPGNAGRLDEQNNPGRRARRPARPVATPETALVRHGESTPLEALSAPQGMA